MNWVSHSREGYDAVRPSVFVLDFDDGPVRRPAPLHGAYVHDCSNRRVVHVPVWLVDLRSDDVLTVRIRVVRVDAVPVRRQPQFGVHPTDAAGECAVPRQFRCRDGDAAWHGSQVLCLGFCVVPPPPAMVSSRCRCWWKAATSAPPPIRRRFTRVLAGDRHCYGHCSLRFTRHVTCGNLVQARTWCSRTTPASHLPSVCTPRPSPLPVTEFRLLTHSPPTSSRSNCLRTSHPGMSSGKNIMIRLTIGV